MPKCVRIYEPGYVACMTVHVTTVFVTTEEAMEVADEIVVMNLGEWNR